MTATAVAVSVDCAPPPPRQGIAALRARHAHAAVRRCAWLRAALDPDVRSASLAMIVKVAMNGEKANDPLYRTFEVAEIACPTPHHIPSPCGKRRRTDGEPLLRGARVVKDGAVAARVAGRRSLTTQAPRNPCDHRIDGAVAPAAH